MDPKKEVVISKGPYIAGKTLGNVVIDPQHGQILAHEESITARGRHSRLQYPMVFYDVLYTSCDEGMTDMAFTTY